MSKIQYSDEEKARIKLMATAFRGCGKYLEQVSGICTALHIWEKRSRIGNAKTRASAGDAARALIHRAIDFTWFDSWLRSNGHPEAPWDNTGLSLAARRAWLEKLIDDCEEAIK